MVKVTLFGNRRENDRVMRVPEIEHIEIFYDDVFDEYRVAIDDFDKVAADKILAAFGPESIEVASPELVLSR